MMTLTKMMRQATLGLGQLMLGQTSSGHCTSLLHEIVEGRAAGDLSVIKTPSHVGVAACNGLPADQPVL